MENMDKTIRISGNKRTYALLAYGVLASRHALASTDSANSFDYLSAEHIVIGVLSSVIILLLGFLIRIRQMRINLSDTTGALEKGGRHVKLLGDNLWNFTVFQLACTEDNQFHFTYLSKGFERSLSISREQVLQDAKLAFDHLYEDDIPLLMKAYEDASANHSISDLEIRALDKSGHLKWLRLSIVPVRDEATLFFNGFIQDISSSKQIETELVEEKRNLENLFESVDDFMIVCDMNGNILHTNPSVTKRLDYTEPELAEMSLFELYADHQRNESYQVIARMQSEPTTTCGVPLQTKSGTNVPVEMKFFRGSWKQKPALFGVARDIGGRQQTEAALRESQKMLRLIMDTIPISVFWKDKDSVYLGCNQTFIGECKLDNIDDVVGKTPYDLFDIDTATSLVEQDRQVITTNTPTGNSVYSHALADGSVQWREANLIPLRDNEDRAVGVLGVWRDVTEQNRGEDRLKRTLDDMERFNQLMRGRERRTLELKAEINALLSELERPSKYKTTTDTLS